MIEAAEFAAAAAQLGYRFYAAVPCSYLTPLIDHVIDDASLVYLSSANEGDAVAAAAGAKLGGRGAIAMMQNSGLGNAVNPITSLLQTFEIPVLLVVTLRGDPERGDEPQHRLMGSITPALLDAMQVPWAWFPRSEAELQPALRRARDHLEGRLRPYALLLRQGSLAGPARGVRPLPLSPRARVAPPAAVSSGPRLSRTAALAELLLHTGRPGTVVVATTGYTGRELCALDDRPNHLYMVGSMGCAASLGLGLALARPDLRVVVVDGDGALLMRLGNLATVGAYAPPSFVHVLLDNGVHDSTGGQGTVAPRVDFTAAAAACGYARCESGRGPELLAGLLGSDVAGPSFLRLEIEPGAPGDLPRPELSPPAVARRLARHLGGPA